MRRENSPEDTNPRPPKRGRFRPEQPKTRRIHEIDYYDQDVEQEPVTPTVELIEYIKGDGKNIPDQVDQWRKRYQEDKTKKAALVELLILVIEACCGKLPTKEELSKKHQVEEGILHHYFVDKERLLQNPDISIVISKLTKIANTVNVEDYLSSENFKGNLQLFWKDLVSKCEDGPLFDGVVFESCMDYMILLSRITVYCQTATRMGLQLLALYIDVANSPHFKEITVRKYDAEDQTEGPHVESLNKTFTDTHKITLLERMIMKIFQGLFLNRYRDDDDYIRTLCIESLENMIGKYPSMFCKDQWLKCLRFFDKVRLTLEERIEISSAPTSI